MVKWCCNKYGDENGTIDNCANRPPTRHKFENKHLMTGLNYINNLSSEFECKIMQPLPFINLFNAQAN